MLKKILFPTDGSENSKRTLECVLEFARKFESEVVILHTYDPPLPSYAPPGGVINRYTLSIEMEENLKEYAQKLLQSVKTKFEAENIKCSGILEKGHAGHAIINTIESEQCDIVIMGSHGHGTLESLLLGSTSNYIVHHTKCPVLLVH